MTLIGIGGFYAAIRRSPSRPDRERARRGSGRGLRRGRAETGRPRPQAFVSTTVLQPRRATPTPRPSRPSRADRPPCAPRPRSRPRRPPGSESARRGRPGPPAGPSPHRGAPGPLASSAQFGGPRRASWRAAPRSGAPVSATFRSHHRPRGGRRPGAPLAGRWPDDTSLSGSATSPLRRTSPCGPMAWNSLETTLLLVPKRILIADDHLAVREGLRSLIDPDPDFEVVGEAADGQDAARKALELRPDLILLDNSMPGMTGLEVARMLRTNLPETKIVFLTLDPGIRDLALATGAAAHVSKDQPPQEIMRVVRAAAGISAPTSTPGQQTSEQAKLAEILVSEKALTSRQVQDLDRMRTGRQTLA